MRLTTHHKKIFLATSAIVTALLLVSIRLDHKNKATRSGLYQFAYEEKGVSIRQPLYIELQPNGQWKMYRLPLQSAIHAPQVPLKGTYRISGQNITFQEAKPWPIELTGPGRPSPVDTARFQGKDFFILSMADGIVITQSASNARYVKIR